MLRIGLLAAAVCLGLAGCQPADGRSEPAVEDLHVQLPVVRGRPGAAYLTLRGGRERTVLKRISSPLASRVEIHESRMEGGVARMQQLQEIEIPAGGEVTFEPGGRHLMLFGLDPTLEPGSPMSMKFELTPPGEIIVEAKVQRPGANHGSH